MSATARTGGRPPLGTRALSWPPVRSSRSSTPTASRRPAFPGRSSTTSRTRRWRSSHPGSSPSATGPAGSPRMSAATRRSTWARIRREFDPTPGSGTCRARRWISRREALGRGFDEELELGEDVDLVWRLHDAGWQVRYDPRVQVAHQDRVDPVAWYRRRVAYNESVSPLLARHPDRVPALFLSPLTAAGWGAWLSGAWPALVGLTGVRAVRMGRTVSGAATRRRGVGGPRLRRGHDAGGAGPRSRRRGSVVSVRARRAPRTPRPRSGSEVGRAAHSAARGRLARGSPGARPAQLRGATPRRRVRTRRRNLGGVRPRARLQGPGAEAPAAPDPAVAKPPPARRGRSRAGGRPRRGSARGRSSPRSANNSRAAWVTALRDVPGGRPGR